MFKINRILFYLTLFFINTFFCGTRFFKIKRHLLNFIGIKVGIRTNVVGPITLNYVNKLTIGKDCWIGRNFRIDGNGNVNVGDSCDIGPNLTINTGGHEIGSESRRAGKGLVFSTEIMAGSWIGTNVLIINGADIGRSSIIAAGAVVNKNINSNSLAAGVPAVFKKKL